MTREEAAAYISDAYLSSPEFPWEGDDVTCVFRHGANKKWFAILMKVSADKLGLEGDQKIDIMNVKCDSIALGSFIGEKGVYRAYHMNKQHWLTLALDGSADDGLIRLLIDMSYQLTRAKGRKKNG
ncbi:MAG: MmcQ/YjbR family DNA-binding protein [Clostridia bacterium]|nr:MmcQ/YjbR family DNA-binding protein [Clostridia bacterium]